MDKPVLCVDIGTSSLKAALIGSSGSVLSFSRRIFNYDNPSCISFEWQKALTDVVQFFINDKSLSSFITKNNNLSPLAVCISGNGPTIVAPTGETLLWNETIDFTTADEKKDSAATTKYSAHRASTPSLFIPRLLMFKKKFPSIWQKSEIIFSGPEYLINKLTDSAFTILPESRYTQAYWTKEELIRCGFNDSEINKLPQFIPPVHCAGKMTLKSSTTTFIEEGTPVFCGGPDFTSALIGTNTLRAGDLCDRAGSSEGLNFCTQQPLAGNYFRTLPSVQSGLWCCDYIIRDSGDRLEKSNDTKLLIELAKETAFGIEKLREAARTKGLAEPKKIILTGGQAQNEKLMQFKADATNLPIIISTCPDAELAGDNIIARVGLGEYNSFISAADKLVRPLKIFMPRESLCGKINNEDI